MQKLLNACIIFKMKYYYFIYTYIYLTSFFVDSSKHQILIYNDKELETIQKR